MIAVMAVACLTANAQNARHGAGNITIQPMIGFSTSNLRGEYKNDGVTIKYDDDDYRTGLVIGAEAEYYTTTHWLSLSVINNLLFERVDKFSGRRLRENAGTDRQFTTACRTEIIVRKFKMLFPIIRLITIFYRIQLVGIRILLITIESAISRSQAIIRFFLGKLNKNGDHLKWYTDAGMLTIGYKFSVK